MTNNKFNFKKVDMDYTGGGIYVLTGQMEDGDWFIGALEDDWVAFVDDDPWANDGQGFYNEWVYDEGHLKSEMSGKDSYEFFIEALKWVKENGSDSNYCDSDLEWHLNYYLNGGDEGYDQDAEEEGEEIILHTHLECKLVDAWLDFIDGTVEKTESGFKVSTWEESWEYESTDEIVKDATYTINELIKNGTIKGIEFVTE